MTRYNKSRVVFRPIVFGCRYDMAPIVFYHDALVAVKHTTTSIRDFVHRDNISDSNRSN